MHNLPIRVVFRCPHVLGVDSRASQLEYVFAAGQSATAEPSAAFEQGGPRLLLALQLFARVAQIFRERDSGAVQFVVGWPTSWESALDVIFY